MQNLIENLTGPLLARLAQDYDLVWRDHRVRMTIPVAVGGQPVRQPFTFPSRVPFLVLSIAWSSIRAYDGAIIEATIRSRERTFVDEFTPLDCIAGRLAAGGQPGNLPPALFLGNEEMIFEASRFFACDPAEVYPGLANASILTWSIRGVELWPKGSQIKPVDNPR